MNTTFSPARSRRTLRRLLSTCQRDLAFYRYCGGRIHDDELVDTIQDVVQVREHLANALSHSPEAKGANGIAQAERLGALHGWETSLRARLARVRELAWVEEVERVESRLLEQVEDATLDPRLSTGTRIMLERHLALVHSSHERAVNAANRIRSRAEDHEPIEDEAQAAMHHRPQAPGRARETDPSLTRAMSNFFYR
jgi:uncharacterized protein (TIGR02284 family)